MWELKLFKRGLSSGVLGLSPGAAEHKVYKCYQNLPVEQDSVCFM